jgi:nucleoid-associated protein YgaU
VALLVALTVVAGGWFLHRAIGSIPVIPVTAGSAAAAAAGPAFAHPAQGQAWVVRPGDTLWGIVEAAGVPGDPRTVVDKLTAELGGRPLQVGQTITVP